jgi:hypothetical protein
VLTPLVATIRVVEGAAAYRRRPPQLTLREPLRRLCLIGALDLLVVLVVLGLILKTLATLGLVLGWIALAAEAAGWLSRDGGEVRELGGLELTRSC